jgi:drug/metabolite transporter (DMT)-like permease
MKTPKQKNHASGYAYLLLTIFLFSTYEVVSKHIAGKIDPIQINCLRFLVGGVFLFIVAAIKREIAISFRDFLLCALAGILNVVVSMGLFNIGLAMNGSSVAVCTVLFACNPVFVSLFASVFDGERMDARKLAALVLCIAGTVLVSFERLRAGSVSGLAGPFLAFASAIVFALYTVLGKRISVRTGSLRMNAWAFMSGGIVLLVLLPVFGRPVLTFDYSVAGWVAYLGVFVSGLAYLTYFKGLAIAGAGKGSLVFFLKPVLATTLAVVILGEGVDPFTVAGAALILSGIAFAVVRRGSRT